MKKTIKVINKKKTKAFYYNLTLINSNNIPMSNITHYLSILILKLELSNH